MSVREEFDQWAAEGRDRGMEQRHWHTAKHALARMPVEPGEVVVDLGTGSGYALRALQEAKDLGTGYGLDASPTMLRNARQYTLESAPKTAEPSTLDIAFLRGDFDTLPFEDGSVDHVFSMEAFYYASDPHHTLEEINRVLRTSGTFYCAVNYYKENVYSHEWQELIEIDMTLWSAREYREAFRDADFHVAEQDNIPDLDVEIPPESAFPTEEWDTRREMRERYRALGTLLTVGVASGAEETPHGRSE
jgi:SAM-dependent methyltransferase